MVNNSAALATTQVKIFLVIDTSTLLTFQST